jgi:putative hemolysin
VFPVDPYGKPDSARANVLSMRHVIRWLRTGGALGVFPSGTVSHLRVGDGVSDPAWHPNVAALARLCGATVVPMFFEGKNSMIFQLAGLIHPTLRTALLPSEMLKRRRSTIHIRIGRPLDPSRFECYPADEDLIQYLRFKTYSLQRRRSPVRLRFPSPRPLLDADQADIIPPLPSLALAEEVRCLPASCRLHQSGDYEVYLAVAEQIPALLREIGRLREVTFRAVSEGTGRDCDLDAHDRTYQHLFLWNRKSCELVGSYRIGCADTLLAREGVGGLYTSTLFKFEPDFIERMGPALEMGRSFIRKEYQRKPTTLALLWRGIGAYLARNPKYKVLFGPVSINQSYESNSLRLLLAYLRRDHGDLDFARLVKAKNPPEKARMDREERAALDTLVANEDDVSSLISDIEHDNKWMPVLLRYYLRLGARVLSFNVDPAFGNCVDGLIVVDLRKTDPKLLKRFMGDEGYQAFAGQAAPSLT